MAGLTQSKTAGVQPFAEKKHKKCSNGMVKVMCLQDFATQRRAGVQLVSLSSQ